MIPCAHSPYGRRKLSGAAALNTGRNGWSDMYRAPLVRVPFDGDPIAYAQAQIDTANGVAIERCAALAIDHALRRGRA